MGMLVDGEWNEQASDTRGTSGSFDRTASTFQRRVTADGSSGLPAEAGRYHLYLAFGCPWCHRVMIFLKLKKLERVISTTYVHHALGEGGWAFGAPEPLIGARFLHEVYRKAVPNFTGRCTVPVLWDKKTGTIVNNESSQIIRMLNREFGAFTDERSDYYPAEVAPRIDAVNERIYHHVNNGAYRCGFAVGQEPYEAAVRGMFDTLDWVESILSRQPYLLGDRQTEADWRLFPTLVRFDCAYYPLFKCNLRHIYEYPSIWHYTKMLYAVPGIAETVDVQLYKENYYAIRAVNPSGVVPLGPQLDFT
ncbi:MAG TPA: glutathione S-transferase C-terminal domain-containing protein [Steroidobacteraceae bacterium]|nr:glutathione S-transferase C-terminal domain-containing protein [Steroidobacteraceae bacterium]